MARAASGAGVVAAPNSRLAGPVSIVSTFFGEIEDALQQCDLAYRSARPLLIDTPEVAAHKLLRHRP